MCRRAFALFASLPAAAAAADGTPAVPVLLAAVVVGALLALAAVVVARAQRSRGRIAALRQSLAASSAWWWETDPEGRVVAVEAGHQPIEGLECRQLLGRAFWQLDENAAAPPAVAQAIATRAAFSDVPVEVQQGGRQRAALSGAPLFSATGRFIGYAGTVRATQDHPGTNPAEVGALQADLEERNRQLAERTRELENAARELDSFSHSVSHDLRAPLRALRGFSHALQEDYAGQLAGKGNQYLEEIRKAGSRMSEVIEGVLELSRSASGKLHCEEVDITALSNDVLKEFQDAEPDRQVSCDVEPGMKAQGDRAMMFVVLQNLLGNAWKYSANRPLASIRIASHADGAFTRYCVSDNGAGFNRNHAEMLFIPFQRLHRQDEFPGLGIGLATVRRIVRRHGGELFVTFAEPGVGATFCFTLPNDPHKASTNAVA